MEPVRDTRITLADLLDRILDKGLLINADLIISVAGVPLIGVKLNAAIASIETMLKYGIMADWILKNSMGTWDEKKSLKLAEGEKLVNKFYGSLYFSEGLYPNWKLGCFYITNRRILLVRMQPFEVLAEIYNEQVKRIFIQADSSVSGKADSLCLLLKTGELFRVRSAEIHLMRTIIENAMNIGGQPLQTNNRLKRR